MKLSTHFADIKSKSSKLITTLLIIVDVLFCSIFAMVAFACFYYARSFFGGVFVIFIPVFLHVWHFLDIKDFEKAYVEMNENEIYAVDYYWGIKKVKRISYSDITSAELRFGRSSRVKGSRFRYIVFLKDKKYLFKIAATPYTIELFKQYLKAE